MGLFDDHAEKFSTENESEQPPGKVSIIVGFLGGTFVSWFVIVLLSSIFFHLIGSGFQLGNWAWALAAVFGVLIAAGLHHLDTTGKGKSIVPICYIISLLCLLLLAFFLINPEFFSRVARGTFGQ